MRITPFIDHLSSAKTSPDLEGLFSHFLQEYGYDRFFYTDAVNGGVAMASRHPLSWIQQRNDNDFAQLDPIRTACFRSRHPLTWDEIARMPWVTKEQQKKLREAATTGLYNGVVVPLHGPCGEVAGVILASTHRSIDFELSLPVLKLMCVQFDLMHRAMRPAEHNYQYISLTPREGEIMHWCMLGKSRPLIAQILNSSEKTIEWHLGRIYRKLGTYCRVTSVVKALQLGLIGR